MAAHQMENLVFDFTHISLQFSVTYLVFWKTLQGS